VRKVIHDWSNGELALHVILSLKKSLRKEEAVNAPQADIEHIDEKAGAALATSEPRVPLQGP